MIPQLAASSLQLPPISIPWLGNTWTVGAFFLIHVLFGSFTMGTLVLGPTFEMVGPEGSHWVRLARTLAEVNIRIFSIGATLAGFAVIFLTALFPSDLAILGEIFFFPLLAAFLIWFPAIFALYRYTHSWEEMRARSPRRHVALGYFAAFMDHIFLVLIVGVDSFLLTPRSGSGLAAFFNPTFFEELGHRFIGNIIWASFFIAGVSAVVAAVASGEGRRALAAWSARVTLAIGLLCLIPQAILGFFFAEAIHTASPGAFEQSFRGGSAWLWLLQVALFSVLLLGSNVYFVSSRRSEAGVLLSVLTLVAAIIANLPAQVYPASLYWVRYLLMGLELCLTLAHWWLWRTADRPHVWAFNGRLALAGVAAAAMALFIVMGIIRTTARGDYAVYGQLTQQAASRLYNPPAGHFP